MTYTCRYSSPLGNITVCATENAVCGLWFEGQKYFGSTISENYTEKENSVLKETKRWLDIYFNGEKPNFTPPLITNSTPFRKAVWDILLNIPYGETITYGKISSILSSKRGGSKISAQAVGGAVGHNPVSILIPCHRVIGANGNLTGYAGGIDKKIKLLAFEGTDISTFFYNK